MITIIYTDTSLVAIVHVKDAIEPLVNAELAGRNPLRNTTHVFVNTIINRYKEYLPKTNYPIAINVVFETQRYFSKDERADVLQYLLSRDELFIIRSQKSLMDAAMNGWQAIYGTTTPWIAVDGTTQLTIGVKTSPSSPLLIKAINNVPIPEPDYSELSEEDDAILDEVIENFNTLDTDRKDFENEGIRDSDFNKIQVGETNTWNEVSNRIFLHINNLNSKLRECKSVFLIGSYFEQKELSLKLEKKIEKLNLKTVLISTLDQTLWAASSMQTEVQRISSHQKTPKSILADTISRDSTPQSQTLNKNSDTEVSGESGNVRLSTEFVVEERVKDQSFLLFFGSIRNDGNRRMIRYISYKDYASLENKTAFIKVYKKERKVFPKLGTVVNGRTGKYYTMPDIKAKSLKVVIAQARINKGSSKNFKSEDIQLLLDIYKALDRLPITFTKVSVDNIFVRRREWWRRNSVNEVYFLGVTPEDSTKEIMTLKLNEELKKILDPTILEHIDHFKNDTE